MSPEIVRRNYMQGLWDKAAVEVAVTKKIITRNEADAMYKEKAHLA